MAKFAACCLATAWASPSLAPAEEYLAPYESDLLDPRGNILSLGIAGLAEFINLVPSQIENWIIGLIVKDGEVSVPVNTSINVQIPAGAGSVDMDFFVNYATVGGLNKFTTLQPFKLMADHKYTWSGSLALKDLPVNASTTLEQWGLSVAINGTVVNPVVKYEAIAAINVTKIKEANFRLFLHPVNCAVWSIAADEDAGLLGVNITSLELDMSDIAANFDISGGTFGEDWNKQFAQNLEDALEQQKPDLIANLSTKYSEQIHDVVNAALLDQIIKSQHETPCMIESTLV